MNHSLTMKEFWPWLAEHTNCILRAGTPDSVLYDDEDYHWRFTEEDARTQLVQLVRGKRLVGEMFVEPEHVSAVQVTPGDKGEYIFDLVAEMDGQIQVLYYFVLSHAFEQDDKGGRSEPVSHHGRLH